MNRLQSRVKKLGLDTSALSDLTGIEEIAVAKMLSGSMAAHPRLMAVIHLAARAGPDARRKAVDICRAHEWRPIPGLDGYEASEEGLIRRRRQYRSHQGARILKPDRRQDGYLRVTIWIGGKRYHRPVHRLVCLAFHGVPEPGILACHRDGNRTNNRAANLYWGSAADNYADQVRHGTAFIPPAHRLAKNWQSESRRGRTEAPKLSPQAIKIANKRKMLARLEKMRGGGLSEDTVYSLSRGAPSTTRPPLQEAK